MAAGNRSRIALLFACVFATAGLLGDQVARAEQHQGDGHCVTLPATVPAHAAARERNPRQCAPAEPTYVLRTTDAQAPSPVWKTTYSANSTYEIFFALDIAGEVTGTHSYTLFEFFPGGLPYGYIQLTYTATSCTPIFGGACSVEPTSNGIRVWTSMPVAGTMIQTAALYGTWTADVYIDTASTTPTASTTFDIEP